MHETAKPVTRAAVVLPAERLGLGENRSKDARLQETVNLAESIRLKVVHTAVVPLRSSSPATLLGEGQVENLGGVFSQENIDLVVLSAPLTPVQQRNLERAWNLKVIDRTSLILDIFGERARTREGVLQVELAHLEYQRSRLVRTWTHLGRQRGGFGFLGGPGETQIEADRRLISDRIARLKREIEEVRRTRGLHREARKRASLPVVALVGYTNAGKSTLFNTLTGTEVFAHDQLFATLDPTMRGLELPVGRRVILSDTVGFISELPTQLVAAFRATLEEVAEADVILHVQDISHADVVAQRADVGAVLDGMVEENHLDPDWRDRTIDVLNKADLLNNEHGIAIRSGSVLISARTGEGLQGLVAAIETRLSAAMETADYDIAASEGAPLSWLYEHGEVIQRHDDDQTIHVTVRLLPDDRMRFERRQFG
jgi:GTP-binding protein HflX